ncbi:MAG: glutathionylspermidine synthase family protein [Alphaproteobacteria bacterium]|nr:glutathionylspermidine synthase family protein [Alphaproteobacteria bacterium]
MERRRAAPRADWRAHVERDLGFTFHTANGVPYWDESVYYAFTTEEVDALEAATNEVEQMCLDIVDQVVQRGDFARLAIPEVAWAAIERSWKAGERNLYGRFDLRYDGQSPPKLLEYNADTPTALFEAAVVQWDWLEAAFPKSDQFNSIHDRLIAAWRAYGLGRDTVYFSAIAGHAEDETTVEYLRDTAIQAGLATARVAIDQIGWNGQQFVDLDDRPISTLFKLYPWEWAIQEEFGHHLLSGAAKVIEPPWKMILSNKALLVLLWEAFPNHPNLLAAGFERATVPGACVRKPLFGREGANVELLEGKWVTSKTSGPYGAEGYVFQADCPLPAFEGRYPVLGSWVVASQAAGLGIREDKDRITGNLSRFVPHLFE